MKTNLFLKKVQPAKARWTLFFLAIAALAAVAFETSKKHDLVVHEWGTFTSVQGGNGKPLAWHPLQTTALPSFIYDWSKPGFNAWSTSPMGLFNKGRMVTLVRMETPVVYFYSDREQSVDVSVQFPGGLVTEWYPQVATIGPAAFPPKPSLVAMDNAIHKVGFNGLSFASLFGHKPVKESLVEWENVRLLPAKDNQTLANQLHVEKTGNHYFAARDTDAAFVQVDSRSKTNSAAEYEKFLFYRGVGNFATPLKVTTSMDGKVTVENSGKEALAHLFLLNIRNNNGTWAHLDKLEAGQKREWVSATSTAPLLPKGKFQNEISAQMETALTSEGLFAREAAAMVKTWNESWFSEDGVRVLYILPRAWTDTTLPMKLNPRPRELVRVMVGRAEIITPEMENNLSAQLVAAKSGDAAAKAKAQATLKSFGRFADVALQLAAKSSPETSQVGWTLLRISQAPAAFE